MTADDWKNLFLGAGSILEIDPAPLPPMNRHRTASARLERVRKLLERAGQKVPPSPPAPTPDEFTQRLAEQILARLDAEIDRHPECERIRKEVGPVRPLLVFRSEVSLPVVGG
jgi:hypothetical protein